MPTTPSMAELSPLDRAYGTIRDIYKRDLGREASDEEIRSHLGGNRQYAPQNISHAAGNIYMSPEAQAYRARGLAPGTPAPPPGGTTPPPTTPPPGGTTPPPNPNQPPSTGQWAGGGYAYTGFDTSRAQDTSKSAKDAFAYATSLGERAGAGNQWHTKQGAEQFANLYVKPYLEQQGFKVLGVVGDQINIVTREDEAAGNTAGSWFDFVVNADGANPMLAWQIQSGTGYSGVGGQPATLPAGTQGPTTPATPPPTGGAPAGAPPGIDPRAYENLAGPAPGGVNYPFPFNGETSGGPSMAELI